MEKYVHMNSLNFRPYGNIFIEVFNFQEHWKITLFYYKRTQHFWAHITWNVNFFCSRYDRQRLNGMKFGQMAIGWVLQRHRWYSESEFANFFAYHANSDAKKFNTLTWDKNWMKKIGTQLRTINQIPDSKARLLLDGWFGWCGGAHYYFQIKKRKKEERTERGW